MFLRPSSANIRNKFFLYVASKAVEKMHRRMNYKYNSRPFFDGFTTLSKEKCPSRGAFLVSPPEAPLEAATRDAPVVSILRDVVFRDKLQLRNLPCVLKRVEGAPRLHLYTEETCDEFHKLLRQVLQKFHHSLNSFKFNQRLRPRLRKGSPNFNKELKRLEAKDAKKVEEEKEKFKVAIDDITFYGLVLHAFVSSYSFDAHIDGCDLPDNLAPGKITQEDEERDEECEHIETLPLHDAYKAWFRLQVAHFEAVHYLLRYMDIHQVTIEIKVVAVAHPGSSTCRLEQVLPESVTTLQQLFQTTGVQHVDFFQKLKNGECNSGTLHCEMVLLAFILENKFGLGVSNFFLKWYCFF